jgi:hypothetical protein
MDREAKGQLQKRQKTRTAKRKNSGDQVIQDRSGPPTKQDAHLLSV